MELLVITYHYIREVFPEKGLYGITSEQFLNQIDKIREQGYEFVSLEAIKKPKNLPQKSCLLTFDDGLKDHYKIYRILKEKGIWGAFFISTDPLFNETALQVHKMHYILSQCDVKELLEDLKDIPYILSLVRKQYPWGEEKMAILKYILYFELSEHQRNNIINTWFYENYKGSEQEFIKEWYMPPNQVKELGQKGCIGAHTQTHRALATLSLEEISQEVRGSKRELELFTKQSVSSISYPFGGPTAVNDTVIRICKEQGFSIGFTIEKGINTLKDLQQTPLQLKRYDTINTYGGKYDELSRI